MPDDDRKIKGRVLTGYTKFIKKKWGKEGLSSCQKESGVDVFGLVDEKWYPNHYSEQIQQWLVKHHGLDTCRQLGFSVATDIGIISYFARMAGLKKVLSRAADEYRQNLVHGQINVEMSDKNAKIFLNDVNRHESECVTWLGIFDGILHITKTKGTVKKTACELNGDESCVYELRWE